MHKRFLSFWGTIVILFYSVPIWAQANLDVGVVAQELERAAEYQEEMRRERDMAEIDLSKPVLTPPEIKDTGKKVTVKDFKFTGNTIVPTSRLLEISEKYSGREIDMSEISFMCYEIIQEYAKQGYLFVQAFPPVQDVVDQKITIQILEGVLGHVKVEGEKKFQKWYFERMFLHMQGHVLNYNQFYQVLMVMNETPGINVQSVFTKGESTGEVDIVLKVIYGKQLSIDTDYNNYGSKTISPHRPGGTVTWNNAMIQGDRLKLKGFVGTPPTMLKYGNIDYSIPVNRWGGRVGYTYSISEYDVGQELSALEQYGISESHSLKYTVPWTRAKEKNSTLTFGFDYKKSRNFISGQDPTSKDDLRNLSINLSHDNASFWKARNFYNFTLTQGISSWLGGSDSSDPHLSRSAAGAGAKFTKFNASLTRMQPMTPQTSLTFKLAGQVADDSLPSGEQLAIGGLGSLRGYAPSAFIGDYGYTTGLELKVPTPFGKSKVPAMKQTWGQLITPILFVDHGEVFYDQPNKPADRKRTAATGAGVGFRIRGPWGTNINIDWGFDVGGTEPPDGRSDFAYFVVTKNIL